MTSDSHAGPKSGIDKARHYWRMGTWIVLGAITLLVVTRPRSFAASAGTLRTDDRRLAAGATIEIAIGV
jgi:hypothetical protein